ncbi:hypothetical protein [Streptomyces iranensis]
MKLPAGDVLFDPATSTRTFNLVADDYVTIVMLRPLLSELSEVMTLVG